MHTLSTASRLAGIRPADVRRDDAANIRAGAALLASDARSLRHGRLLSSIGAWYGAIAEYAGTSNRPAASAFAHDVYQTIRAGPRRTTADGQTVTLPAG